MIHELKTWPEYFQKVKSGEKKFELRENDRDFKVGDTLVLKEWKWKGYSEVSPNEKVGEYTGEQLEVIVSYVFTGNAPMGLAGGYCILGIETITNTVDESLKERAKAEAQQSWNTRKNKGDTEFASPIDYIVGYVDAYIAGANSSQHGATKDSQPRDVA